MRWAALIMMGMAAIFLKIAFFPAIEVSGTRPELALLVALFIALHAPPAEAVTAAWCLGILRDLLSGGSLGVSALGFMAVALVASRYRDALFSGHFLTQILMASVACAFTSMLHMARLSVLSSTFDTASALRHSLAMTVYTGFVAPFFFAVLQPLRHPLGLVIKRDLYRV